VSLNFYTKYFSSKALSQWKFLAAEYSFVGSHEDVAASLAAVEIIVEVALSSTRHNRFFTTGTNFGTKCRSDGSP
jgi:hypothetical protein